MAESPIPLEVFNVMERVENALEAIEVHSQSFLSAETREIESSLPPLDRARIHVTISHALNALFSAYLSSTGVPVADHPASAEIERVRLYTQKVERASSSQVSGKPSIGVDVAAANRFIEHSIPDLTPEQRKRVRDIGNQHKNRKKASLEAKTSQEKSRPPLDLKSIQNEVDNFLADTAIELNM